MRPTNLVYCSVVPRDRIFSNTANGKTAWRFPILEKVDDSSSNTPTLYTTTDPLVHFVFRMGGALCVVYSGRDHIRRQMVDGAHSGQNMITHWRTRFARRQVPRMLLYSNRQAPTRGGVAALPQTTKPVTNLDVGNKIRSTRVASFSR